MASLAAIVLAAGGSSRLGTSKQLLVHRGEPLLARTVRLAQEAGASPVLAVLGSEAEACRTALDGIEVQLVDNPRYQEGMGTSLAVAMASLVRAAPEARRVLVLVCDQPLVEAVHLRALLALPGPLAATAYGGRVGVPAVFGREHFDALLNASGDEGMRALLRTHRASVAELPLPQAAVDLDTRADLGVLEP